MKYSTKLRQGKKDTHLLESGKPEFRCCTMKTLAFMFRYPRSVCPTCTKCLICIQIQKCTNKKPQLFPLQHIKRQATKSSDLTLEKHTATHTCMHTRALCVHHKNRVWHNQNLTELIENVFMVYLPFEICWYVLMLFRLVQNWKNPHTRCCCYSVLSSSVACRVYITFLFCALNAKFTSKREVWWSCTTPAIYALKISSAVDWHTKKRYWKL